MILVDIYVPAVNRNYDFRLDENAYTANILDEIGEMMMQGDSSASSKTADMLLCDYEGKRILPLNRTLKQCGIGNGCRLVLL